MTASPEALEAKLDHRFADRELLVEALTHPSADPRAQGRRHYDRLEFLGDRVLGLIVASRLFARFPEAEAGQLSDRLNALVRLETAAEVAREIGLGAHLIMARSEAESGGREKTGILGDACEAVIGALYLDGGLPAAERFVERCWKRRLALVGRTRKDAKNRLQEKVQGAGRPLPVYELVGREGPDHAPSFTVEVRVEGARPAKGEGPSRRLAEQMAAERMLRRLARHD
jgi:ribonuclease III